MSPSPNKAQLNVRVDPLVKAAADERAKNLGKSMNAYIEDLIRADTHVNGVSDYARSNFVPGQMTVDDMLNGQDELADETHTFTEAEMAEAAAKLAGTPAATASSTADYKAFETNCVAGVYHWKNGPGNPCRSCGGEI